MADNSKILKGAELNAKLGTLSGILSGAASLYSGIVGRKTAKTYGRMQQRAAEAQARLNELATERNIAYQTRQAQDQIADIRRGGRQALGRQLATMAAAGVSTAIGSAQALLRSTGYSVGRDISTIQANLINSAYEQRRQTAIENIGLQYQGQMAKYAAKGQAFGSIAEGVSGMLSAATSVASRWNSLNTLRLMTQPTTPTITNPTVASAFQDYTQGAGLNYLNTPAASIPQLNTGMGLTDTQQNLFKNFMAKNYGSDIKFGWVL